MSLQQNERNCMSYMPSLYEL